MRKIIILALLAGPFLRAQSGHIAPAAARGIAMGHTGLTLQQPGALFSNPAGIATQEAWSAQLWADNRFLIAELQSYNLGFILPTNSGSFGLTIHQFGFDAYTEQRIGLAFGRALTPSFQIGAQALYHRTNIPEFGSRGIFTFELGLQTQLLPTLRLGARAYNPLQQERTADGEEVLPTVFALGLGYSTSSQLLLLAEVEKDIDFPARFKGGLDYAFSQRFSLQVGVRTEPAEVSFGLAFALTPKFRMELASSRHPRLGFSPAFGMLYQQAPPSNGTTGDPSFF